MPIEMHGENNVDILTIQYLRQFTSNPLQLYITVLVSLCRVSKMFTHQTSVDLKKFQPWLSLAQLRSSLLQVRKSLISPSISVQSSSNFRAVLVIRRCFGPATIRTVSR